MKIIYALLKYKHIPLFHFFPGCIALELHTNIAGQV